MNSVKAVKRGIRLEVRERGCLFITEVISDVANNEARKAARARVQQVLSQHRNAEATVEEVAGHGRTHTVYVNRNGKIKVKEGNRIEHKPLSEMFKVQPVTPPAGTRTLEWFIINL